MCANNRVHYGLMVVYGYFHIALPHYHHYVDLSEGMELLKCLSDIFFPECVSKFMSILSIIFHAICGVVWIQLTHFCCDDCENACTWSYYHHQIGSMTHFPLFRVRSWNNGMRCMSFYILMEWSWILMNEYTFARNIYGKIFMCRNMIDMYCLALMYVQHEK